MRQEPISEAQEEVHRIERALSHIEAALHEAMRYALVNDSGWDLVRDLQKGYFRYREALAASRARLLTPPQRKVRARVA